ncbi:MAG: hypothetical protein JNM86_09510 [Phycisphaerae bacterium]|nr:hypothetical protein [Phycisphaerae bacterium]MBN8597649.1 hypothetical protein [Planctomycetota bacterium]
MVRFTGAVLGGIVVLSGCQSVSDNDIEPIGLDQTAALYRQRDADPLSALFIDPRPRDAFESAHIPGAVNLSLATFDGAKGIDPRISQFKEIVVYGQNPGDVAGPVVSKRMMQIGYADVRTFAGGVDEWRRAALPLEDGPSGTLPAPMPTSRRGSTR